MPDLGVFQRLSTGFHAVEEVGSRFSSQTGNLNLVPRQSRSIFADFEFIGLVASIALIEPSLPF